MNPIHLFLLVAATWRMTSLVCNEEGPFAIFEKNRQWFRRMHKTHAWFRATHLYNGVRCEWCTSIWVAFPFLAAYTIWPEYVIWYATALTLSAGTIVVKYIVQTLSAMKEYYENIAKVYDAHDDRQSD